MWIPSLPWFPDASVPEIVWATASLIGTWLAVLSWRRSSDHTIRLKCALRAVSCALFLLTGLLSLWTPPVPTPTLLSVTAPIAIAVGATVMALLSVIDTQTVREASPTVVYDQIREAMHQ